MRKLRKLRTIGNITEGEGFGDEMGRKFAEVGKVLVEIQWQENRVNLPLI